MGFKVFYFSEGRILSMTFTNAPLDKLIDTLPTELVREGADLARVIDLAGSGKEVWSARRPLPMPDAPPPRRLTPALARA